MGRKYLDKVEIKGLVYLLWIFPLNNPSKMTFLHNNNQNFESVSGILVYLWHLAMNPLKKRPKNLTRKKVNTKTLWQGPQPSYSAIAGGFIAILVQQSSFKYCL